MHTQLGALVGSASPNAKEVLAVCGLLRSQYGRPRLGNPRDPLDDLVYILLSNKTLLATSQAIYCRLRASLTTWEEVLCKPFNVIERILRPGGLSRKKTAQLRAAMRKIVRDWGQCSLSGLKAFRTQDAEAYLTTLPGVSVKVAKCVLMYTLNRQVLPVDVHVHRISVRLGWCKKTRADASHTYLEELVPPNLRFGFHVGCIVHGRTICKSMAPKCDACSLRRYCNYSKGKGIPQ